MWRFCTIILLVAIAIFYNAIVSLLQDIAATAKGEMSDLQNWKSRRRTGSQELLSQAHSSSHWRGNFASRNISRSLKGQNLQSTWSLQRHRSKSGSRIAGPRRSVFVRLRLRGPPGAWGFPSPMPMPTRASFSPLHSYLSCKGPLSPIPCTCPPSPFRPAYSHPPRW